MVDAGVDPVCKYAFFLDYAFFALYGLLTEQGVNYVIEYDFQTLDFKILKISVLHELLQREQVFIGNISPGHV
jgi:hypothetical protein